MKFNIAAMVVLCGMAGTRAGYIGYPTQALAQAYGGLSVASIDSLAKTGGSEHIASVKHVAELPQQVIPLQTLPFQHATVQHDVLPMPHETWVKQEEVQHATYPVLQGTYAQAYPVQHHASFPIQKTYTFPVQKTIFSYPSKYHY
jgi:hypothetical protein